MINKKTFQRIDANNKWIESVEVSPTLIEIDGSYQVDYVVPDGCIDADVPPDGGYYWDGESWVLLQTSLPEMPEPKVLRRIDNKGFFVADEVIFPELTDGVWSFPNIEDPDLIDEPVPQTKGLHKPKYQNGKWVEGATKKEIQLKRGADWYKFSDDFTASSLDELIAKTKNIAALNRFNRLLNNIPKVNTELLCKAWNDCLSGLDDAATSNEKEELNTIISNNNLPLVIGSNGTLSEVGND